MKEQATLFSEFVKDTLNKSGFVFNVEKTVWQPDVTTEWLCLFVNTQECFICLPKRRMISLLIQLRAVLVLFHPSRQGILPVSQERSFP